MSKTITKKLEIQIKAEHIQRAFALMELPVLLNAPYRLFGRDARADLVIPDAVIQQLGLPALRYSDGIGVLIREDGSVSLEYDHYNHDQAAYLETFLAGLNAMGAHARAFESYKAQGYTIEAVIDQQELGIFLSPPQGSVHDAWGSETKGGWRW